MIKRPRRWPANGYQLWLCFWRWRVLSPAAPDVAKGHTTWCLLHGGVKPNIGTPKSKRWLVGRPIRLLGLEGCLRKQWHTAYQAVRNGMLSVFFERRNVIFYSSNLIIIRTPISHTKRPSATPSPGRLARVPAIHLLSFVETKGGKETHVKQHTVIPRFQHQQPSNTKIQEHQTVCPWFRHQSSIRNFISLLETKHTKRNVRNLCTRFRRLFGFAVGPPAGLEAMARISLPLISIS